MLPTAGIEAPPTLTERGRVRLRDGRHLAYSAAGRAGGVPVLYMHGAIGSPVRRAPALERVIRELDLRYVMLDRPGFGDSDPHPGRSVASIARDVEDFADAVGLDRFAVIGVSAGGPYALACAHALPYRVPATACVSSMPPGVCLNGANGMSARYRLPLKLLRRMPVASAMLGDRILRVLDRHPGLLAAAISLGAPASDRALMNERQARETVAASFLRAAGNGVGPMIEDFLICSSPWGFELGEISGQVEVWHGVGDRLVPLSHVAGMIAALPRCRAHVTDGDGHFFFRTRLEAIIRPLAEAVRGPASTTGLGIAA